MNPRRRYGIRNRLFLCSGAIFGSCGVGGCLYRTLKDNPNKWTAVAAFVVGSAGTYLMSLSFWNVHCCSENAINCETDTTSNATKTLPKNPNSALNVRRSCRMFKNIIMRSCWKILGISSSATNWKCSNGKHIIKANVPTSTIKFAEKMLLTTLSDVIEQALENYRLEVGLEDNLVLHKTILNERARKLNRNIIYVLMHFTNDIVRMKPKLPKMEVLGSNPLLTFDSDSEVPHNITHNINQDNRGKIVDMMIHTTRHLIDKIDKTMRNFIGSVTILDILDQDSTETDPKIFTNRSISAP